MLKKSFIHIDKVNKNVENEIWKAGILNWEDIFTSKQALLSSKIREHLHKEITKSIEEYNNGNIDFFANNLPRSDHWRMYQELKNKCCFLDIETTGLNRSKDIITLIGLYDGNESKIFINGKNMQNFDKEVNKYNLAITYNGACFDLPFIKNKNPEIKLPSFHIDLRYALKNIGFTGGLKKIERDMGVVRSDEVKDIDGFEAIRLWKKYKNGDKEALNKLIAYNTEDIQNLKPLMDKAYKELYRKTFIFHSKNNN